ASDHDPCVGRRAPATPVSALDPERDEKRRSSAWRAARPGGIVLLMPDVLSLPLDCAARYRADRVIAFGGFGTVILGNQLSLDRPVAIKILNADLSDDAEQVGRFLQEARVTAAVHGPHIVKLLDHGAQTGVPWI